MTNLLTSSKLSNLAKVKNIEAYPSDVKNQLKLLMVDRSMGTIKVIGSGSYAATKFSGDWDFYEDIKKKDKSETIAFFVRNIKRIVKKISASKKSYFMEVKAGIDYRYLIQIGICHNDVWTLSDNLHSNLQRLIDDKLFDKDEIKLIKEILDGEKNQYAYETLGKILRNRYIIRWSKKEILNGSKILPSGVIKTLESAVMDRSNMNIEIISVVNGKYRDVSNFFVLGYVSEDGKIKVINLPQESVDHFEEFFDQNLKSSMEKLCYSIYDYNPLKLTKRYFSYARIYMNPNLLMKTLRILNSDVGLLGQIKSELGTLIKLYEKNSKYVYKNIMKIQLQDFKYKISSITGLPENIKLYIYKMIDNICDEKTNRLNNMEELEKLFKNIVDTKCEKSLRDIGLFPVPRDLLPIKREF